MSKITSTDTDNIPRMFPLPSTAFITAGTQAGIILKFKTFYLKIYDADEEDAYSIRGYRYHEQCPVFDVKVPWYKLRKFASKFSREDYLTGIRALLKDIPNHLFEFSSNK